MVSCLISKRLQSASCREKTGCRCLHSFKAGAVLGNQYLRWLEQCSEAIFTELLWENKQRLLHHSNENIILNFHTKLNSGPFCRGFSFYQALLV